ncbi:MAG: hypothetical protein R3E53_06335 [Myxococcota bacterium]
MATTPTVHTHAWYNQALYELADDEALVITGRFPACRFANVVLWNHFMQSYDYANRQISLNRNQVHYEKDGSFRIVVAHHRTPACRTGSTRKVVAPARSTGATSSRRRRRSARRRRSSSSTRSPDRGTFISLGGHGLLAPHIVVRARAGPSGVPCSNMLGWKSAAHPRTAGAPAQLRAAPCSARPR